jgi:hypothetical protein
VRSLVWTLDHLRAAGGALMQVCVLGFEMLIEIDLFLLSLVCFCFAALSVFFSLIFNRWRG